jgi:hypothetical protein
MTITYHPEVDQGSDEWLALRCGILTASEVKHILTPTLKTAANDKSRAHVWEIAAQRISQYVEPTYIGDDMLRGMEDEAYARDLYSETRAPVIETGFVTNDEFGFTIGYSPDGLIGAEGLIEIKSRKQKFQIETIVTDEAPSEFMLQLQTGMLVTGRAWIDFISYSGGLPMFVKRVHPDFEIRAAIIDAATKFEADVQAKIAEYHQKAKRFPMTERRVEQEIQI